MSLINRLKLAKLIMKFAETRTDNGILIHEGEMVEGLDVFVENEDELIPAPDGEYANEEMKITVVSGKVESIEKLGEEPVEEPVETPTEEPETMEEEVENPTNEGEETDTEAIVEIRKEIDELYARIGELEKIIKEKDETIETLNTQLSEIVKPAHNEVDTIINNKGVSKALKYFQKQ